MAANPVVVPCPSDVWTKVATAIQSGVIHKLSLAPNLYKQTFKLTGEAAPTDDSTAALLFGQCDSVIISEDADIDVYVKAVRYAGSVRVDA